MLQDTEEDKDKLLKKGKKKEKKLKKEKKVKVEVQPGDAIYENSSHPEVRSL